MSLASGDEEENFGSANESLLVNTPDTNRGNPIDFGQVVRALQAVAMVNYDSTTGEDTENALEKACHMLKGYEFQQNDLDYYFNQVELKMRQVGVKKNYTKLLVLTSILPLRVSDQVKSILRKQETDFGADMPYKILKDKIIKIFKPPQEAKFERAMGRTLTATPSQLARELVNDLCDHELEGCCCSNFIVGLWKRALPNAVKQAVAAYDFNKDNFDTIVTHADKVYASTRSQAIPSSVAAVTVHSQPGFSLPGPSALNEAFIQDPEVAAMQFGQRGGRGGQGGRGQGRGQGRGGRQNRGGRGGQTGQREGTGKKGQNTGEIHPRHKTARHTDLPPFQACSRHWFFGKAAHFCEEPGSCPWKDFWVPKSNSNQ